MKYILHLSSVYEPYINNDDIKYFRSLEIVIYGYLSFSINDYSLNYNTFSIINGGYNTPFNTVSKIIARSMDVRIIKIRKRMNKPY